MKKIAADTMIYYQSDEPVNADLTECIRHQVGIIRADHNPYVKHLINVEYDPIQIDSRKILNLVRERGLPACLIGM